MIDLAPYIISAGSGILYNAFSYFVDSFTESDIFFDKSLDYGETWGLDTDLNPTYNASAFTQGKPGRPSKSMLPAMAVDQNGVFTLSGKIILQISAGPHQSISSI